LLTVSRTRKQRAALVLALDGASFDVIEPLVQAGRLPNLGRWMRDGYKAPLRSTCPPVTFPAWSTFMTGLEPGRHGIFDFTQKVAGAYRLRFVNASHRHGTSLFGRVSRAKGRVLVLGMPATFPPEPVSGLLVSGFDAPISVGTDARQASDPDLYRTIAERVGPWMRPDLNENAGSTDFHERAVKTLLARIERKTAFALEALRTMRNAASGDRPDLMTIVFSESDTVGHHYFRDHDANSPRHDPTASAKRKGAVAAVYEKLDAACGEIRAAFGEDALCVVLSDHGMGAAGRHIVHANARLAECGLLERRKPGLAQRGLSDVARGARDLALRTLPPRQLERLFRRARPTAARLESTIRFGGLDWPRSAAFSEEANTQPGVWVNLRGREAQGSVAPTDYERVREDIIASLLDWKLPGGEAVVARARRREEVYTPPFADRAPDVVFELGLERGYGLSLVATPAPSAGVTPASLRRLEPHEFGGGRGRGMNGTHRPDGILIVSGEEAEFSARALPRLRDVAPSVLAAMGLTWSGEDPADGRILGSPLQDYTPEEDARVAARLRALGYLE
jgi:predicted AlkP superfamily phosphohydrolase/phosphomutase